ncbi:MAG TPA: mechanosensitive ion channel domain-containing protein [Burkholderiales bacterium]|nr:mechanosensitive ion channel domain-containing protein [Burkholderiales bacterium]
MGSQSMLHEYVAVGFSAAVALAIVIVGLRIAMKIGRRLVRHHVVAGAILDYAEEPARLLLSLLALQGVWHAAPDTLPHMEGLRHLTVVLLIGAMTWLLVRIIESANRIVAQTHPVNVADNLRARSINTQTRVLGRTLMLLVILFGVASALMTFPSVRQIGTGLLASAGLAGLVVGFAAKPLLGNVLAGLQIALTQPIRLDDVVVLQGEFGRVEEITGSYVVVALWDERRLVVPLQWFIENPFQNWTRTSAQILGSVFLWVDFGFSVDALRAEAKRLCEARAEWDRRVCGVQVTDANERAMQLRVLVSSASASLNFDLRCFVREKLIEFIRREHPQYLPKLRTELPGVAAQPEPAASA